VNRLGGFTAKKAILGVIALIVVGGIGLALLSGINQGTATFGPAGSLNSLGNNLSFVGAQPQYPVDIGPSGSFVVGQTTVTNTVTLSTTSAATITQTGVPVPVTNSTPGVTQGSPGTAGGLIEFSTNLQITAASPEETASAVSALAYTVGGYVAYQDTYTDSANVVIRVPSADFQTVLNQVRAMGVFVSESSNSNDVRVQYTDLNATLTSLKGEQSDLLRFLNQSTNITTTLKIESQLQQVNQQINDIESQILQMKTLIDYATINVTVTKTSQATLPTTTLSATPKTGMAPLSVTFNANVKGGVLPYVEIYNFGDGTNAQGQTVIHTFYTAGDYNVTLSVTDQAGNSTSAWTMIHVTAAPIQSGLNSFFGYVSNLFLNVIEGIVEVAVVVLPLAAVGAAIVIPIQRHERAQKNIKQSQ
jgi:hypothetical protein